MTGRGWMSLSIEFTVYFCVLILDHHSCVNHYICQDNWAIFFTFSPHESLRFRGTGTDEKQPIFFSQISCIYIYCILGCGLIIFWGLFGDTDISVLKNQFTTLWELNMTRRDLWISWGRKSCSLVTLWFLFNGAKTTSQSISCFPKIKMVLHHSNTKHMK